MPAMIAWELRDRIELGRSRCGRASCLILAVGGMVVGFLSTITTIIGLFEGSPKKFHACAAENARNLSLWSEY